MEIKIQQLFEFLKSNRKFNNDLQLQFFRTMVGNSKDPIDKLISLLYHVVNTQSQPKINLISNFFQHIYSNQKHLSSFGEFVKLLDKTQKKNFEGLYECVRGQKGWGQKTSALFAKNIYLIHNKYNDNRLKFWKDVPKKIERTEKFYLPVDSVILAIFHKLDTEKRWTFDKINNKLNQNFENDEIEIWDDLWFWGFINQKGGGKKREFEWNEAKYWIIRETDKNLNTIKAIEEKSNQFLEILEY